jgi:ParB-like chromosome segregation protein Spo0J
MKNPIQYISLNRIRSKWYTDLLSQWQPDQKYIDFLIKNIEKKSYSPPIVVVREGEWFFVVNGHHRYYAHLQAGESRIKCIVIEGTFEESEPLRKAEVLLKEFDRRTHHRYQLSGYLDRWAADAEKHSFINKYNISCGFRLCQFLKKIVRRIK